MKHYRVRTITAVCQLQQSVLRKGVLAVQLAHTLPLCNVRFFFFFFSIKFHLVLLLAHYYFLSFCVTLLHPKYSCSNHVEQFDLAGIDAADFFASRSWNSTGGRRKHNCSSFNPLILKPVQGCLHDTLEGRLSKQCWSGMSFFHSYH